MRRHVQVATTCLVALEEWTHTLRTAKLQQTRRPVIPPATEPAAAPLAEIEYWNAQFDALKTLSSQVGSHG